MFFSQLDFASQFPLLTETLSKGCYAISVTGKLPGHYVRELKARGITYRSRDRTNQ